MFENVFESKDRIITPEEYAELMFRHTSDDGILYIPGFGDMSVYLRDPDSLRCKMEWTEEDLESVLDEFHYLYEKIRDIAPDYRNLRYEDPALAEKRFDKETLDVWETYLKDSEFDGFDREQIDDIGDRLINISEVKRISADIAAGKKIDQFEMELYKDLLDSSVTKEELDLYDRYWDAVYRDSEERIGSGPCAYQELVRARRLCLLMDLGAPENICKIEERMLICAMILHRFCLSLEIVDNDTRLRANALARMSEEELDELFRPQKMNSRKSMAPLFVFLILQEKSSPEKHMRQQEILAELSKFPYEIILERKALSRIIHNLVDSQVGIFSDLRSGVWYDAAKDQFQH